MNDDRPSIAELQRVDWSETVLLSNEAVALRGAAPVLLEIVAAALRYRAGMSRSEVDTSRCEALDRALCKVRE